MPLVLRASQDCLLRRCRSDVNQRHVLVGQPSGDPDEARNQHFPKMAATTELGSKAAEGAGIGAVAGGGLGALLMGLAAAGFAIPGLPIIAMGPLAAALTGAGTGGGVGALIGALVGSGIPEERARLYE